MTRTALATPDPDPRRRTARTQRAPRIVLSLAPQSLVEAWRAFRAAGLEGPRDSFPETNS